jgi:hypothetical protein
LQGIGGILGFGGVSRKERKNKNKIEFFYIKDYD